MKLLVKAMRKAWYQQRKRITDDDCEVKEILSYIADDGQLGDHLHDLEPDPDILGPLGHGPPRLADELLGVQPDLHPVVEEGEQGGQGEGRHEDCDETELEHWNTKMVLRIVTHYHNMTLTSMTSTYDYIWGL